MSEIKINTYLVIQDCIEKGVNYGWMRAYKHSDNPDEEYVKHQLQEAILNTICEYFKFDNE